MDTKARNRVLDKMVHKHLITREEANQGLVSDERIEMFIKGILMLEGEQTVDGQIEARQKAIIACQESGNKTLIAIHEKYIKKLKQVKAKLGEKQKQTPQIKMSFTKAKTQYEEVQCHLKEFKNITSWDAFTEYGITRLSHYIYRLRNEENWSITTINISKTNRYGNLVTFAKYVLDEEVDSEAQS